MRKALVSLVILAGFLVFAAALAACEGTAMMPRSSSAQLTLAAGSNQLWQLSQQQTVVAVNMVQAAATQTAYQQSIQRENDQAATQRAWIVAQTQEARNYQITQTARVEQTQSARATGTSAAIQTATAWSITETPLAATQAAITRENQLQESLAFWKKVSQAFWLVAGAILFLVVLIGSISAFRRLIPAVEIRLRSYRPGRDGAPLVYGDDHILDPTRSVGPGLRRLADGSWEPTGLGADPEIQERTTARAQTIELARTLPAGKRIPGEAMGKTSGTVLPTSQPADIEIVDAEQVREILNEVETKLLLSGDEA